MRAALVWEWSRGSRPRHWPQGGNAECPRGTGGGGDAVGIPRGIGAGVAFVLWRSYCLEEKIEISRGDGRATWRSSQVKSRSNAMQISTGSTEPTTWPER
ncbi:hypothetical protein PIB30_095840 [Stylosanthes scabra]|uniref:Uncharacterized protein n=1 Tax=Stylosanthes scabra TaxID=79078 RepID=A0ABU6SW64_9FABA|nr:hypothetical protein [Stylosanthes scabra]